MRTELEDRVVGVLIGLAAGDRIGGPTRMALRVAVSLLTQDGFDVADIGRRYLEWWQDGAFDTGPTVAHVLSLAARGVSMVAASAIADTAVAGMTAGCNPAHRCAPLSMCVSLADSALSAAATTEAKLTHLHPLAGDVAAAVVCLCRALIRGTPWTVALGVAAEGRRAETVRSLGTCLREEVSVSGYAPETLGAAVHFVGSSTSFETALTRSVEFAGPANYCAVLVGSIGGARWGQAQVNDDLLRHHSDLVAPLTAAAESLSKRWVEVAGSRNLASGSLASA